MALVTLDVAKRQFRFYVLIDMSSCFHLCRLAARDLKTLIVNDTCIIKME